MLLPQTRDSTVVDLNLDLVIDRRQWAGTECCSAGWPLARRGRPLDNHGDPLHLKIPPNHESAVNTMAVDDDAQQQPRNAAANGGHQDPADHDEHGLLVTLRADLSDEDVDAVAQSIEEVSGVVAVQRYVADPSGRAAVELNDSRWRESIVHLLDDEGV